MSSHLSGLRSLSLSRLSGVSSLSSEEPLKELRQSRGPFGVTLTLTWTRHESLPC